jgi:phosphoribosylaminoimidazole carboxylase
MLNILGSSNNILDITRFSVQALSIPGASVHLYGKAECRKGRKMGRVTVTAESDAELRQQLLE